MTTLTRDADLTVSRPGHGPGLGLALASALAFGMSGSLARPLLDAGWSPGAVVTLRISIGAALVLPLGLRALAGHWGLLRRALPTVVLYGLFAVAGAQFCYFSAVQTMDVAAALMVEYTAPALVVVWMWLAHGQRPGPLTVLGAAISALGLLVVLDLFSGAQFDLVGTLWALAAAIGATVYFVLSADDDTGLPPMTLAAAGLVVGGVLLGLLGLLGLLPLHAVAGDIDYAGLDLPVWLPVVLLGLVTAAIAYGTGIAASRRLGSRLASFVALGEIIFAVFWAWVLVGQVPVATQLAGGALILLGVVAVKLGERTIEHEEPVLV
ncbi:EamA family transporter [Nocardioides sp. zg-536]|uniref:EamA family transporter n=1 Tax=Nocardioides faecalis TaxID=2803858 RepID=A0A938Y8L8_9ACTN|nr:EamA family transporter [Nocardioides faecalis]QVI57686.1 EamA family transporter [Nocardioides faecalis]